MLQTDQLALTGGASAGDCASRITKKVDSRRLALQMNFCGSGPKAVGLKNSTVWEVIKGMCE